MPMMTTSATTMRTGISHSIAEAPFDSALILPTRNPLACGVIPDSQPLPTEHAIEVRVAEQPLRVEKVAQGDEVVESGVARPQRVGAEGVHLAPVRPTVEAEHDLLDRLEVLGRVLAPVAVD